MGAVMRLEMLSLKNFRCFRNELVRFSPYTAIVGPNNSGKSTVFKAIDLFFRTTQRTHPFSLSDFNDPKQELRIALTFSNVPEKAQSLENFGHYYRHGKLEFFIRATTSPEGQIAASVHGTRLGIKDFGDFFTVRTAADKKTAYTKLREKFPDLPDLPLRSSVDVFAAALLEYEGKNPTKQTMIDSEDLAFGAAGVASRLRRFVDWVYIPAVKDASEEDEEAKNTAFGILVNRIIRARVKVDEKVAEIRRMAHGQVESLVEDYKEEVKKLEGVLDTEFRRITSTDAHIHLDWTEINAENVTLQMPLVKSFFSDDTFRGEISQFGHGLQRNYLMTLVHLNAKLAVEDEPSIVLACEEPELYQHPPQARYLHIALEKISQHDQVLITTHSPYFISARTFENVRLIRKSTKKLSTVTSWTADQHRSLIAAAYGQEAIGREAALATLETFIQPELNEAFFCSKLVLVEGLEDKSIFMAALQESGELDEFLRLGGHIVGVNGKGNLINMTVLARGFETPYFLAFDADAGCKPEDVESNKKLNAKVVSLSQLPAEKCIWPDEDFFGDRAIIWRNNIQSSISNDYQEWYDDVKAVCTTFGWQYARLDKNPAVLSHTLQNIFLRKKKIACLERATEHLMKFARS